MREDVARDLDDSAYDFLRLVWPAIREACGGGRLVPVESAHAKELDTLAGVDAWQMIDQDGRMRGIASRVQWIPCWPPPWSLGHNTGSFTIRTERPNGSTTEFEKRWTALNDPDRGWLMPHLTIQGYCTPPKREGMLLGVSVIKTSDLINYAADVWARTRTQTNPVDNVKFKAFWWDEIQSSNIRIKIRAVSP